MLDRLIDVYKKYGYMFQGKIFLAIIIFYKELRVKKNLFVTLKYILGNWNKIKVYKGNKVDSIAHLLDNIEFECEQCNNFVYTIDIFKTCQLKGRVWGNCTVNYSKIIDHGLVELYMENEDDYSQRNNQIVDSMIKYIDRLKVYVSNSSIPNKKEIIESLLNMSNSKAETLHEALQRILVINQIQWQTGHILVGLGRLDYCIDRFVETESRAKELIDEFFELLNKYYAFKSNALIGDTGQIIILGGSDANSKPFHNMYTRLILDTITEKRMSDPKILYRVCSNTSEEVWDKLLDNMVSLGPTVLLANDNAIIPRLVDFGYEEDDAINYITSACWEPIAGVSYEQNNILSLNFLTPFNTIKNKEFKDFDDFLSEYKISMTKYVRNILKYLDKLKWDEDPIYSLFDDVSREKHLDISNGGSKYLNYGILSVGLSNAVNSLLNIKNYVFDNSIYKYVEFNQIRKKNYKHNVELCKQLKTVDKGFGTDENEVIELTNYLIECVRVATRQYRNVYHGKVKFGLSSPHFIMNSKRFPASFDGRKDGEPFGIHISGDSSGYVEVINLASRIEYKDDCINGNVVDLNVQTQQLRNNMHEYKTLFKVAFDKGVHQMQMHSLDSSKLIEAKKCPEKYPDLIVRVWGFNAYFSELPEEYKDYIIERALRSEAAVNKCATF